MSEQPLIPLGQAKQFSLGEETQFAANGIVSRTVLRAPHARVVLFGFAAGQELTEHSTPRHALVQIISGSCEMAVAGTSHQLKTGDVLYMPPGAPHALTATEACGMLLTLFEKAPEVLA